MKEKEETPLRLVYSTQEVAGNRANYNAAVTDMGGDILLFHVFWDK